MDSTQCPEELAANRAQTQAQSLQQLLLLIVVELALALAQQHVFPLQAQWLEELQH
jgi:hypothetical protein